MPDEDGAGRHWETRYGIKVFSPIAKNFPYSHYNDFGSSRSYGFRRTHLGNDLIGQVGTPVIAVEGGTIEALGWNQYGGWRIGIRSFDRKRYYYYAHLRKDFPTGRTSSSASAVKAGDVIGYLGRTATAEKKTSPHQISHLHFGDAAVLRRITERSNSEIWIKCTKMSAFSGQQASEGVKNPRRRYTASMTSGF